MIEIDGVRAFTYFVSVDSPARPARRRRFPGPASGGGRQYVTACYKDVRSTREIRLGRTTDSGCGGAAQPLPPGAHAGEEDGQGADLLAGDLRVHEHQRHPDSPRPLELRPLRQARRRLQHRLAALGDPQDPAHAGPAQHRARRRRPARSGDRQLADLRRARDQHRRRLRQRPGQGRDGSSAASP